MTNSTPKQIEPTRTGQAETLLGESTMFRGELTGNEDLRIEGQFEGNINLQDHALVVGQHGKVKAEIHARRVTISGSVNGNISATEKVEIRKTGRVVGEMTTGSIAIEEGGYFKGSIDILREAEQGDTGEISTSSARENLPYRSEPVG